MTAGDPLGAGWQLVRVSGSRFLATVHIFIRRPIGSLLLLLEMAGLTFAIARYGAGLLQPSSWRPLSEFIGINTRLYLYFGSWILLPFVGAVLLGSLAMRLRHQWVEVRRRLAFGLTLLCTVFLVGVPVNLLFTAAFRDSLYHPGDPVVDFLPHLPLILTIDFAIGGHFMHGGNGFILFAVWLIFAAPIWYVAWLLSRRLWGDQ